MFGRLGSHQSSQPIRRASRLASHEFRQPSNQLASQPASRPAGQPASQRAMGYFLVNVIPRGIASRPHRQFGARDAPHGTWLRIHHRSCSGGRVRSRLTYRRPSFRGHRVGRLAYPSPAPPQRPCKTNPRGGRGGQVAEGRVLHQKLHEMRQDEVSGLIFCATYTIFDALSLWSGFGGYFGLGNGLR